MVFSNLTTTDALGHMILCPKQRQNTYQHTMASTHMGDSSVLASENVLGQD